MKFSTLLLSASLTTASAKLGNLLGSAEANNQHGVVAVPLPEMYAPHAPSGEAAIKDLPVMDVESGFVNKDIQASETVKNKDTKATTATTTTKPSITTTTSSSTSSSTSTSETKTVAPTGKGKPNVLLILVDDQGHGDIDLGTGAAEFDTPTLSALATEGVHLKNFYSAATCTPSRAMLMTGRYAIRYGFQDSVIHSTEPRGVPLSESFLSEKMQKVGYTSVMIGKW